MGSIVGVKISVSLPEEDVGFLDEYVAHADVESRSAAIHDAIAMLRAASLEDAYAVAWDEWESGGDAEFWGATTGDGITDASR